MTTATVSRGNPFGLSPALKTAQEAIHTIPKCMRCFAGSQHTD